MQQSITSRYILDKTIANDEHIDITVTRHDSQDKRRPLTTFSLSLNRPPTSNVDPSILCRGSTAIELEAIFDPRSLEICISNIRGRALERGQSFARKTYQHLLQLTPECTSLVLYNIINSKAGTVVDNARENPDWIIPPEGVLLRSLYECGFNQVVGIQRGGSAYRCVRAFNLNAT